MAGDDNIASKLGLSKLNMACLNKSAENVATLLDDAKTTSQRRNQIDEEDRTAVHYACQNKKEGAAILELLINRGFSLQLLTNNGSSPLHEAYRNGNSNAAQLILGLLRDTDNTTDMFSALELKEGNTPTSFGLSWWPHQRSKHVDDQMWLC